MKQLSAYINEKLVLNKDTFKVSYNYFPETRDELRNIIKQLLEERKKEDVIDMNDIDTSNINDMSTLFFNLNIINIDISDWNMSNVTNTIAMFYECKNLKSIGNISRWDMSKVKYMTNMFYRCENLESIGDISDWDVSAVKQMGSMFKNCKKLKDIGDLSDWNISKVKNRSYIFKNSGITNIPDWYEK